MGYGGNTSCIQIQIPGTDELLIVDCGTGFRNLGNELDNRAEPLKGRIFVTHPHWDHLQGFPFFKPFYSDQNWFRVYLPPQNGAGCRDILHGHMSNTFFPVTLDMLEADMDCFSFEPKEHDMGLYKVDYMWAKHTIRTAIFRFKINDKIIIFAPDNELPTGQLPEDVRFIDEFRNFVNGADVLIHDGQYSLDQIKERTGWGHSAWETVAEVCSDLDIKHLFLTHHDPDSDDIYLKAVDDALQAKYATHFEQVSLAKEGDQISI